LQVAASFLCRRGRIVQTSLGERVQTRSLGLKSLSLKAEVLGVKDSLRWGELSVAWAQGELYLLDSGWSGLLAWLKLHRPACIRRSVQEGGGCKSWLTSGNSLALEIHWNYISKFLTLVKWQLAYLIPADALHLWLSLDIMKSSHYNNNNVLRLIISQCKLRKNLEYLAETDKASHSLYICTHQKRLHHFRRHWLSLVLESISRRDFNSITCSILNLSNPLWNS
jgi:hypothetical protein